MMHGAYNIKVYCIYIHMEICLKPPVKCTITIDETIVLCLFMFLLHIYRHLNYRSHVLAKPVLLIYRR